MRPSLIVHGNCQAEIVASLAAAYAPARDGYDIYYHRSFVHPTEGAPVLPEEALANCAILFSQRGITEAHSLPAELPETCLVRKFPALDFAVLWPLSCPPVNTTQEEGFPFGRFPYGDRAALDVAGEGRSGAAAFDRYMEVSDAQMPSIERLLRLEAIRWSAIDRECDIAMGAYILENYRRTRLFWTCNHPKADLVVTVFCRLMASLGDPRLDPDANSEEIESLRTYWADRAFNEYHQPVHPRVARTLGLEWWSQELLYNFHNSAHWNFEEFMTRYIEYASGVIAARTA